MTIFELISSVVKIVLIWLNAKTERDERVRKEKEALLSEAKDAIKDGDTSRITSIFNELR